ncbi:SICA antigen [Plasmodium coatneyi]|uniref:SICA antigen n=1 Tax=Plasmodium coatneyi TaxID=208452 RepID=A0A1B1E7J5_9APIC|nr:SICA antigen [Plasmodium coatneyi]ANQ10953.1 SICA antigen [Plasmodium coatneyi]
MTYYLWKYFFLGKRRKRHRRAHQVSAPPSLGEQFLAHVEDQADGPHEYTLVKKRRKPRSAPVRRRKRERAARRVGHRTIIDIHLEVLDECQKGDLHSTKEDFFEILVREFMESEFMKEEIIPMKHVPSLDSGFREEDFVSKDDVSKIEVPSSDSGV